jgi:hypothetical protein
VPALHASFLVQKSPSSHDVPFATGTWTMPDALVHESAVHGLPSSIFGAGPRKHVPDAVHVSMPLQPFPSVHDVPTGSGV